MKGLDSRGFADLGVPLGFEGSRVEGLGPVDCLACRAASGI